MLRMLIAGALLFGVGTSVAAIAYRFRRKMHRNRLWTTVVLFGILGFVIASIFSAIALIRNDDSAMRAGILWPTSIIFMAGEPGDPISSLLVVFGAAILSNVVVYGFVGLVVGGVWKWVGPDQPQPRC